MSAPTGKITEFTIGKGITQTHGKDRDEHWTKKYFELTVHMPEQPFTDAQLKSAVSAAEYLVDTFLGQPEPETPQIPDFNPEDLMKHPWKGKKVREGEYAPGSLNWGWDFADQFPETVRKALEKGSLEVNQHEFTMTGTTVTVHKKKGR